MRHLLLSFTSLSLVAALGCEAPATEAAPTAVAAAATPAPTAASQPAAVEKGTTPETRGQTDEDGVIRRGDALSTTAALTVPAVFDQAKELGGKSVKVTGTVDQVCAAKGCWMVLKDDDKTIRITSKGYKFFVPQSAKGKTATLEGDLVVKEMSQAEAQHLEDDAAAAKGGTPKKVDSGRVEVQIAAVALEMM